MKLFIKTLLREGIEKNLDFVNRGKTMYKTILNKLDSIDFQPTTKNDTVEMSDGSELQLNGVKFNLKQFDEELDVEVILAQKFSPEFSAANFDMEGNRFIFFILPIASPKYYNIKDNFIKSVSETTFVHEFTHFLDKQRYKSSYKFNYPGEDVYKYFNSPEELNAYFNEGLHAMEQNKALLRLPKESFMNAALQMFNETFIESLSVDNLNKLKKRIYQYYVNNSSIQEAVFTKTPDQVTLMNKFVVFAANHLKIKTPQVKLQFNREGIVTTAAYGDKKINVYAKDRALVDIMRSIAHEMVHLKQDVEGKLKPENHEQNNADGSPIENEANSVAGEIIRKFGKLNPKVYI